MFLLHRSNAPPSLVNFPVLKLLFNHVTIVVIQMKNITAAGITLKEDISDCDILMGIKEVPKHYLIPGKKYFFFSHTIKKQPHNRELLKTILEKKVQLIDYECLVDPNGNRVIGFGRFAGIVGAYNGLMAYGKKYSLFDLKPAHLCHDKKEVV